jgi:hypothetical protein
LLEFFPLVVGAAVGIGLHHSRVEGGVRLAAAVASVSLALGAAISALAGELAVSPLYILWDAAQVSVGALAVLTAVELSRRRRSATE